MLQKQLENFLIRSGISIKSLRNYKSDISHFLQWAILRLKSFGSYVENLQEIIPFLTPGFVTEYKQFMIENKAPQKTINRRLSSLRQLSKFLMASQIMNDDFMVDVQNVLGVRKEVHQTASLIDDFTGHLEAQKVSRNTIKNYQSDIRQFLVWLENNHARFA